MINVANPLFINVLFARNTPYAIEEIALVADPLDVANCLFDGNTPNDYFDHDTGMGFTGDTINGSIPPTVALNNKTGDSRFVMDVSGVSGTSTAPPDFDFVAQTTLLTDAAASFAPGELKCQYIIINTNPMFPLHLTKALILDNTETTILIKGFLLGLVDNGNTYLLVDYDLEGDSDAVDMGTTAGAPAEDILCRARLFDIQALAQGRAGIARSSTSAQMTSAHLKPEVH